VTILQFLLLTLAVAILVAAGIILHLMIRLRAVATAQAAAGQPLHESSVDEISRRVAAGLGASPDATLDSIASRIDQLRAEFDWVVGESLIHQAVALARSGQSEAEIAQTTGISADELQAIRRFRRH
jgi:hypothetical protein